MSIPRKGALKLVVQKDDKCHDVESKRDRVGSEGNVGRCSDDGALGAVKNFRPDEGPLKDDVLCVPCQTSRPEAPELCGDRRGCECDEDGVGLDVEVDKTRRVEVPDPFAVARRTLVRAVVVRVLPTKSPKTDMM